MKIYLLRHAESQSNALGRLTSDDDEQLTSKGLSQAESIVPMLGELGITKVLCSTSFRAKQTIRPFLDDFSANIEYSDLLIEGQLVLEAPAVSQEWGVHLKRSESAVEFLERTKVAMKLLLDQKCERFLVVTHGHMIRELINLIIESSIKIRFSHENCGLSLVEIGEYVNIKYVNRAICPN